MDHQPKSSWIDTVPARAALGLGAALGIGALGVVGFLVLLPSVIGAKSPAPPVAPPVNVVAAPPAAPPVAPSAPVAPPAPAAPVNIVVTDSDHVRGPKDARVTIVEWSDYQCPFCSRFHPSLQQAIREYPNDVRWVYRHFPLESIHPNARPAAEAAECAAEQGKFWEFSDKLFERQSELGPALFSALAKELGLNAAQFDSCVKDRKYQQRVRDDEQAGLSVGVQGTPGSFVNGVEVPGAVPYAQLKSYIDAALAK